MSFPNTRNLCSLMSPGLVEGVVEVMRQFLKLSEVSGSQELPKEVHSGVLILYSFVATPAAHLISKFGRDWSRIKNAEVECWECCLCLV